MQTADVYRMVRVLQEPQGASTGARPPSPTISHQLPPCSQPDVTQKAAPAEGQQVESNERGITRLHDGSPSLRDPLACLSQDPLPRLNQYVPTDESARVAVVTDKHTPQQAHPPSCRGEEGKPMQHPIPEVGLIAAGCSNSAGALGAAAAAEDPAAASSAPQPEQLAAHRACTPDDALAKAADRNPSPQEPPIVAAEVQAMPQPAVPRDVVQGLYVSGSPVPKSSREGGSLDGKAAAQVLSLLPGDLTSPSPSDSEVSVSPDAYKYLLERAWKI